MKQSASRLEQHLCIYPATIRDAEFPLASRRLHKLALNSLMSAPVEPRPLLALQRLAFQGVSAICVCDDFRSAQRYFFECIQDQGAHDIQPFLAHEMMPGHQQKYTMDCIYEMRDTLLPCSITLFTTRQFFDTLVTALPWLIETSEILSASPVSPGGSAEASGETATVSVSCICLRAASRGRWLLMDHDKAATVQADVSPAAELVPRLLAHAVNISGDRLAPYLAMMFDVPQSWKSHLELATRSLLIFDRDVCDLGCRHEGMPSHISWSDLLGIVY